MREREARQFALRGLFVAAGRAADARPGSVEQVDARTSANDWRAALALTCGADVVDLNPVTGTNGH